MDSGKNAKRIVTASASRSSTSGDSAWSTAERLPPFECALEILDVMRIAGAIEVNGDPIAWIGTALDREARKGRSIGFRGRPPRARMNKLKYGVVSHYAGGWKN